ncbi:MAG: protein kinase, partial [Myxococcales bacterium]|nr:protein kinase [Myxococcales bacterium]
MRLADESLEIVGEIGRGGIAVVYRAIDHTSGKEVALKIGTAAADGRRTPKRFRREHRIGLMLGDHEQIVRPLRVGVLDGPAGFEGRMYLVTELVEGKPLDIVMAVHRHGLDVRRACAIGRDVGQALVAMHARGIVHRDIKPGNV